MDRALPRRARGSRLPRGGLRAPDRVPGHRPARHPRLVASGLAVTLTSQLLAGQLHGVHVAAVRGEPARRALYALLPETGAREIDRAMVEQLTAP